MTDVTKTVETFTEPPKFLCMKHGHTTHIISFKLPGNQKTYCMECLASWISKNFDAVEPVDGD